VDAAAKAGVATAWVIRDGALPVDDDHKAIRSFDEL
jgi:methionine salvage enolase-phosphatase E1